MEKKREEGLPVPEHDKRNLAALTALLVILTVLFLALLWRFVISLCHSLLH